MAESGKILVTGLTYDCKDELKDRFGAMWDKSQKGWLIDNKWYEELVEVAKQHDLLIDGVPAINITGGDPTMQSPKPQPQTKSPSKSPSKAGTSLPATTKPVTVDYLNPNPPDAKPEIIQTHRGDMRVIKRAVLLDESNTHLIEGKRTPSAVAYTQLANAAGVKLVKPDRIDIYDPESKEIGGLPNPYLDLSPNGQIRSVTCRYVALGFTASGNLSVSDRTIYLNMASSLIYSLMKEIKDCPSVGQIMSKAAYDQRPETKVNWAYWVQIQGVDDESTIVIAFDPAHEAVQKVYRGYAYLNEFAERHAQTKAATMALRNFPGVGIPDIQGRYSEKR